MERKCSFCQEAFDVDPREVRRGNGRFCSLSCSGRSRANRDRELNCVCAWCSKPFYRATNKKLRSRSGLQFCTRHCKDRAQRIGGVKEIHPVHYGVTASDYRTLALRTLESRCNKCGYNSIVEVLHVHHRDENRNNNSLDNLEVLCPTCHEAHHFLSKSGKWTRRDSNSHADGASV